ncbi:hypothetical protein [Ligilactobacillus agilis]|nr:hypothetical protein [Ligilactobacillus agilis]
MTNIELKLVNKLATSQYNEAVLEAKVEELQAKIKELEAKDGE